MTAPTPEEMVTMYDSLSVAERELLLATKVLVDQFVVDIEALIGTDTATPSQTIAGQYLNRLRSFMDSTLKNDLNNTLMYYPEAEPETTPPTA